MKFLNAIVMPALFISVFLTAGGQTVAQGQASAVGAENKTLFKGGPLPTGYNSLFAGSGECLQCHDSQVNNQGEPIGIISDWQSSMMAHSSKDPFWRAKVSHETLVNPDHAQLLEDVCTRCHAPLGNFDAHFNGQPYYSLAQVAADPLARDGVSCTLCHQITPESLGNYSGEMLIGQNKTIWGQYPDPFGNPMISHTGYTPAYSPHIESSQLCGSCHSLLTPTIDYEGNLTGTYFPEQAIYHEWLNSNFSQNNITCQKCHMPHIDDVVKISSMPPWLTGRTPFAKHHLAGANVFMLKLIRDNLSELGITATEAQLDSTINRAKRMLQQASLEIELVETNRTNDTLFLSLELTNLSGHKFPTGYPSRRAFVELFVMEGPDTIFHSGKTDNEFNLVYEDEGYEMHHQVITNPAQVQVYEMVMGDVNLQPTTVLAYAYQHLKDNRIPPAGFNSSHFSWDTVAIAGMAMADPDFNKYQGIEGSGSDVLHFHVPVNGSSNLLVVSANVYYQTVSNRWLEHMFTYTSDEIETFKSMYQNADKTPVKVAQAGLTSSITALEEPFGSPVQIRPNPGKGTFWVDGLQELKIIHVYNQSGERIQTLTNFARNSEQDPVKINLDLPNGVYLVEMINADLDRMVKKIIIKR